MLPIRLEKLVEKKAQRLLGWLKKTTGCDVQCACPALLRLCWKPKANGMGGKVG